MGDVAGGKRECRVFNGYDFDKYELKDEDSV